MCVCACRAVRCPPSLFPCSRCPNHDHFQIENGDPHLKVSISLSRKRYPSQRHQQRVAILYDRSVISLSYRIYVLLLEVDESWQALASWAAAGRDSNRSSPTFLRTVITSFPSFRKCDACDVGDAKCGDGGGLRRHDVHHHCHVCCGLRGRDGLQDRSRHPRLCHLHLRPSYCLSNVVLKRLSCRQDV